MSKPPERIAGVIFGELPPAFGRSNRHVRDIIFAAEKCGVTILNLEPPPDSYRTLMVSKAMLDFSRFAIVDGTVHTPLTWFVAGMAADRQIPTLVLLSRTSLPSTDYLAALNRLPIKPVIYFGFEETANQVMGFLSEVRKSKSFGREVPDWPTTFSNGDLRIDYEQMDVSFRGEGVKLTKTEYRLLARLSQSVGRFVPEQFLVEAGWGDDGGDKMHLKTYISRLRKKVGDTYSKKLIMNRAGLGYMLTKNGQAIEQHGNGLAEDVSGNCLDYYTEFLGSLEAGEGGVVKLDSGENPLVVKGHLVLAAMVLGKKIDFFKGDKEGDSFFEVK